VDKAGNIVNYFEVDKYMIENANNKSEKVKNMADCLAAEITWCLSGNFEKDCKFKGDLQRSSVDIFARARGDSDQD
jgi:hypothetical protein